MAAKVAATVAAFALASGERIKSHKASCGTKGLSAQIVNGEDATACEWNWQVGFKGYNRSMPFCGGMLISDQWVLTAAHCCNAPDFDVVAGDFEPKKTSGNEQRIPAAKVIQHPRYSSRTMDNDFALVKLAKPVEFNSCVGAICLPTAEDDVTGGEKCWITGWGTLASGGYQPDILQEAEVSIISNADCVNNHDYRARQITDSMICAQGRSASGGISDACQGDSGGPLVCQSGGVWKILGATSWGYGCAGANYPGIWARVPSALDWIESTMSSN